MNGLSFTTTRIAPTPSGYLHIGNAMSFLITAMLAKKANAKLLLRIDDLDRDRTQKHYVEDVFHTLRFLGIDWHEGPKDFADYETKYSQARRMKLYNDALQQLRAEGLLFACQCSRKELQKGGTCQCSEKEIPLDKPFTSWRLITDEAILLTVRTMDDRYITDSLPPSMAMMIVRRKDGVPAYQLCSVVDDDYFGVDAIVRGHDLWDSTLAQQYIASLLKKTFFQQVVFYHHPLLMNQSGDHKLSKSAGDTSIRYLISQGNTREGVLRMIEDAMAKLHIDDFIQIQL